jgi:hypothetical protein
VPFPVVRDRFKGDVIQRVPDPEGIGRILGQLGQLLVAMRVIGVTGNEVWSLPVRSKNSNDASRHELVLVDKSAQPVVSTDPSWMLLAMSVTVVRSGHHQ